MPNDNHHIKLLWTGGWDSTFRLLQIVLVEKSEVQPYYIMFNGRWSLKKEIKTMNKIKRMIYSNYPFTKNLINETIFIREEEIEPDQTVTNNYHTLKNEKFIGTQNDTIVRFAKQFKLEELEMGIAGIGNTFELIKPFLIKTGNIYKINKEIAPGPVQDFYKYFNFPLLDYRKKDMAEIADKKGWISILNCTWMCHKPIFGFIPCGACNPCMYAAEDEFAKRRIPILTRLFGKYVKKFYNSEVVKFLFR